MRLRGGLPPHINVASLHRRLMSGSGVPPPHPRFGWSIGCSHRHRRHRRRHHHRVPAASTERVQQLFEYHEVCYVLTSIIRSCEYLIRERLVGARVDYSLATRVTSLYRSWSSLLEFGQLLWEILRGWTFRCFILFHLNFWDPEALHFRLEPFSLAHTLVIC